MNNIIRSQLYLCKRSKLFIIICFVIPLCFTYAVLSFNDSIPAVFDQCAYISMFTILFVPVFVISFSYYEHIQMYEIMSGISIHKLMLGKAVVYLSFTTLFLVVMSVMCLIFDRSGEMRYRLLVLWIICLRATLCIVFLSPLLKEGTFAPIFTAMLPIAFDDDTEALLHSPVSYLAFGQCRLLGQTAHDEPLIKVAATAVAACVIYYFIGYLTLKKKFQLEPSKML